MSQDEVLVNGAGKRGSTLPRSRRCRRSFFCSATIWCGRFDSAKRPRANSAGSLSSTGSPVSEIAGVSTKCSIGNGGGPHARERSFAFLMLDVDEFKPYNDRYGHRAGDRTLTAIATCIAATVARSDDLSAGYGGEEFAILLPATDTLGAYGVAETIRVAIAALRIVHATNTSGFVTVSIGAAAARPVRGSHPGASVEAADAALYDAKRSAATEAPSYASSNRRRPASASGRGNTGRTLPAGLRRWRTGPARTRAIRCRAA